MPHCPRCRHPAHVAPTICTQCGTSVPDEVSAPNTGSAAKGLLLTAALVLLAALLFLAISYVQGINQLFK